MASGGASKPERSGLAGVRFLRVCLLLLGCAGLVLQLASAGAGLVINPSAEEIVAGKPVGWGCYRGKGEARLCSSDDAHSGVASACLVAGEFGEWRGRRFLNCGLVLGSPDGYRGVGAYTTQGGRAYRVSFWMKGSVPRRFLWQPSS